MAHSIESRVPFLTPSLVDAVLELPEDYILGADGTTKAVFRDAMRGIVPDAILDRRDKIGFATPEASWLAALRPWVEAVLTSDAARRVRALDLAAVKDEWDALARGEARFDFRFWRWINVVRWAEVFDVSFD
jgi:asparagine synthase (glutamine-hydrolysing)